MGVYIRGMEMPTSCIKCQFSGFGGIRNERVVCMLTGNNAFINETEYLADCPLDPVPPHGRLIDVKSLENMHFTESVYDNESKLFVPFVEVASAIFNAPTIIEGES